jgi:hypothetical protein
MRLEIGNVGKLDLSLLVLPGKPSQLRKLKIINRVFLTPFRMAAPTYLENGIRMSNARRDGPRLSLVLASLSECPYYH